MEKSVLILTCQLFSQRYCIAMNNVPRTICCMVVLSLGVCLSILAHGTTVAYWQMNESRATVSFHDAASNFNLTNHQQGGNQSSSVAANPIPHPDPLVGHINLASYDTVRAYSPTATTTFNMTHGASWTLEGWIYWTGSTDVGMIFGTRSRDIESGAGWDLVLQPDSHSTAPGRLDWRMVDSVAVQYQINSGSTRLYPETWHHIALVWDHTEGTYGTQSLYIDGNLVGWGPATSYADLSPKYLYVGARDWSIDGETAPTDFFFYGNYDDTRFCNAVLEPSDFLTAEMPCISPDLNRDHHINFQDFSILSFHWLEDSEAAQSGSCGDMNHPYPPGDLNMDCIVNTDDFEMFLTYWPHESKWGNGLQRFASMKSDLWESEDTDWTKWVTVIGSPTRIYMSKWKTDAERLDYQEQIDPDFLGLWSGASMNRGDFFRMRGVAVNSPSEYEYQESIGPMYGFAEEFFTGNGVAIKEDGTVPLRSPWNVPFMCNIAPKWHEVITQGMTRMADSFDAVYQDNIAAPIDAWNGGNFCDWCNKRFIEYLKDRFDECQLITLGVEDVDQFHIRDYLQQKRQVMNNESLIEEPVIHEYIRYQYIAQMSAWIDCAEQSKLAASKRGAPIPVMYGHQSGGWGSRVLGLPLCDHVDVLRMDNSGRLLPCFRSGKEAQSTLVYKVGRAAGNYRKPVWNASWPGNDYGEDKRVPAALFFAEAHANGGVPVQSQYYLSSTQTPCWDVHRHHAQFINLYRSFFIDRSSLAEIALVESLPSLCWRDFSSLTVDQPHFDHFIASARLLEDKHIPYEVVILGHPDFYDDTENLARMGKYKTLIVPFADCISDKHADAIIDWTRAGGKLVLWGQVGTRNEELAQRDTPVFDSLIADPGLGTVEIVSEALAGEYRNEIPGADNTIANMIIDTVSPVIETTNLPETVWINVWHHGAGPMISVQMVNYNANVEADTIAPAHDFTLRIKCPDNVTYVQAMYYFTDYLTPGASCPRPQSLPFVQQGNTLEVEVPNLDAFGVIVFSVADEQAARYYAAQARKWYERLKIACRCKGQSLEDHSVLLSEAQNLLSQIQGPVAASDFSSLVSPLQDIAQQLEARLDTITQAVESLQSDSRNESLSVEAQYKFDFGDRYGPYPSGWQPITKNNIYSPLVGYGWTSINYSVAEDTDESDDLHRDFMRSIDPIAYASNYPGNNQFPYGNPDTHPVRFRVDLPNGEYIVTVLTGDYTEMAMNNGAADEGRVGNTYVDMNDLPMLYGGRLKSGYYQCRSFRSEVTDNFMELTFWGDNVGPLYHNSIEWLVNGLVIQTPQQALMSDAQEYLTRATKLSAAAVRDWYVIGPFDDDGCEGLQIQYGPEEKLDIGQSWPGKNGAVSWLSLAPLTGSAPRVSLSDVFNDVEEVAGFCQSYVYCPQDMNAKLVYSLSQTGIGWVNGKEIFQDKMASGLLLEEETVVVTFDQGWNSILIKTLNHWGSQWSLHVSLLDENNQPLINTPGIILSAEPAPE